MRHLTYTGFYAGQPLCGCDMVARLAEGDTFCHVPYSNVDEFFQRVASELCPQCKAEWDSAADEDENDNTGRGL